MRIMVCAALCIFCACNLGDKSGSNKPNYPQVTIKDTLIRGMQMVYVPQGKYKKGLDAEEASIRFGFYIGKYEVTVEQFGHFLDSAVSKGVVTMDPGAFYCHYDGDSQVPVGKYRVLTYGKRLFRKNNTPAFDTVVRNHPVTGVTWYGAMCFCRFYGFDLPSEAEWEKAARGDNNYWFPWGNEIDSTFANYYMSNDPFEPGTTPVGYFNGENHNGFQTSNAVSVFGCYDMAGNAWEWTKDFWSTNTPFHTGKGGGYHYHTPAFLQVYYGSCYGTSHLPPLDMNEISDGFRVVLRNKQSI